MSWLEQKYINLLSTRLDKFKRKSGVLWNFRCPICGDSETNKSKARGYIYSNKGEYLFHCHNCGDTKKFNKFLKMIDLNLFNEYTMEVMKEKAGPQQAHEEVMIKMAPPVFKEDPLKKLKKISALVNHPAKRYVVSRQIPTPYHAKLYYAKEFKAWVNSIIPNKFQDVIYDEPRLVIPFVNDKGDMIGFQGRSLKPDDTLRYITIMIDETQPRLYGMDALDTRDRIYVFEGPIDSMFIANSIASAGGEIKRELPRLGLDKSCFTVVYDNEPRNKETVKKMESAINDGYDVCIWPDTVTKKDVNDMVKAEVNDFSYVNTELVGRISNRIRKIIDQNTYSGLQAKLKLTQWRKC